MIEKVSLPRYPQTMKSLQNWVLWNLEKTNGRETKIPYSALYNGKASSTNPDTWTSYDIAYRELVSDNGKHYSGLGFVFSKESNLIFIDIDHCIREDGELDERAKDILNTFENNTYVEVSQSGTGLHLFVKGTIPKSFKNPHNQVEMYYEKRFVAMTGNVYIDREPVENPEALSLVYEKYKTHDRERSRHREHTEISLSLSDNEIIRRASENEVSGESFRRLFSGDIGGYPSHSEADLRLCQILAFWCNRDYDTIYRLITSSGAYREKWDRKDYSLRTITCACDSIEEDLEEFTQRKRREERLQYEKALLQYW